jgi:hypothetical protein
LYACAAGAIAQTEIARINAATDTKNRFGKKYCIVKDNAMDNKEGYFKKPEFYGT